MQQKNTGNPVFIGFSGVFLIRRGRGDRTPVNGFGGHNR